MYIRCIRTLSSSAVLIFKQVSHEFNSCVSKISTTYIHDQYSRTLSDVKMMSNGSGGKE